MTRTHVTPTTAAIALSLTAALAGPVPGPGSAGAGTRNSADAGWQVAEGGALHRLP
ncbi:hypothetical protein ABZ177_30620 [Streptomyces sp. NPDC006284]|uniref:hypothetical protein n=1 Tax=unclassified Streptomyces TaxID=2593676 RepID=UPI0033BE0C76